MPVVVVGSKSDALSEGHAGLLAIPEDLLPKVLREVSEGVDIEEVVVLSTCLRTEIYAVLDRFHPGVSQLQSFLAKYSGVSEEELSHELMVAYDESAISHLFEVASGLDSAVLGEGEVLSQVRRSLKAAQQESTSGPILNLAFRHAIESGKKIRSDTKISQGITSMAHASIELAIKDASSILEGSTLEGSTLKGKSAVVVGTGEMGAGIARALFKKDHLSELYIVNRTFSKALTLADEVGGTAIKFEDSTKILPKVDFLFLATAAKSPIIDFDVFRDAVIDRQSPLVVVDTSIQKNIDSKVGELPKVTFIDLDEIRKFAEEGVKLRQNEVEAAMAILSKELLKYHRSVTQRGAAPIVSELKRKGEEIRQSSLDHFRSSFKGLSPTELESIEALTKRIVATLLHEPTARVKESIGSARGERLAEALRHLFDIS